MLMHQKRAFAPGGAANLIHRKRSPFPLKGEGKSEKAYTVIPCLP